VKPDCLTPDQWTAILTICGRVDDARRTLARRMGRGLLHCNNCKRREGLTALLAGKYLREGWPACCEGTLAGGTMGYYSSEQQLQKELARLEAR
jgi:hypothetical protein